MAGVTSHRATYIRERGIWYATCRNCGWQTSDVQRRRAMSSFRVHIQDQRGVTETEILVIAPDAGSPASSIDSELIDLRQLSVPTLAPQRNVELQPAECSSR